MPPSIGVEHKALPRVRISATFQAGAPTAEDEEEDLEDKSSEYSDVMQQRMGSSLTYCHEDGVNFAHVLDNLMVGSCLQTRDDVDRLADDEGVGAIVNLQEDSDMAYFDLDLEPIRQRCAERGDVAHNRFPIRDFDPFDLRRKLAGAVQLVADQVAHLEGTGRKVYIHCTAGLGRAPATALAYMYWCRGFSLEDAISTFMAVRPCNPRIVAIRQATLDLLVDGTALTPVRIAVSRSFGATSLQIAGLDVGWGQQIDMQYDPDTHRYVVTRSLPPGRYPYKFIMDGRWTYSADHPTFTEGDHTNNYVDVISTSTDPAAEEARERLLSESGTLTSGERQKIEALFGVSN
ncbi:g1362 [Coccomyxa elongata]